MRQFSKEKKIKDKKKKRRTSEANVEKIWVISNLEREYIIILYALLSITNFHDKFIKNEL